MASRAISVGGPAATADWRLSFKRSLRRAGELAGALGLVALIGFIALALVSYRQTDPSASTAAGGQIANWMGAPGAWTAERLLFVFGWPSFLVLPLLYLLARRLWALSEDEEEAGPAPRWWRLLGLLALAMALLGTV